MYRSAFLAAALLSFAQAAKAESGLASYYSGHGHRGEMTCAHRTRPLGSIVTVTRADHSVQCRVNDRRPFVRGRVIDVSISAAQALGMMRAGAVRVSVQRSLASTWLSIKRADLTALVELASTTAIARRLDLRGSEVLAIA
jgi:rare lipoprotein A